MGHADNDGNSSGSAGQLFACSCRDARDIRTGGTRLDTRDCGRRNGGGDGAALIRQACPARPNNNFRSERQCVCLSSQLGREYLLVPILAKQFDRVRSADRAVATTHVIGWTELIASPADPLRMLGMKWGLRRRIGLAAIHSRWSLAQSGQTVRVLVSHSQTRRASSVAIVRNPYWRSARLPRTTCNVRPPSNQLYVASSTG